MAPASRGRVTHVYGEEVVLDRRPGTRPAPHRTTSTECGTDDPPPPPRPRRRSARRDGPQPAARVVTGVAALALVVSVGVLAAPARPSPPTTPRGTTSWRRRPTPTPRPDEITNVKQLLAGLATDLDAKNADAVAKGTAFEKAQTEYDQAEFKLGQLQQQADAASDGGRRQRGARRPARRPARALVGRQRHQQQLISDPGDAGQLLYKIGAMTKLTEQADGIYSQATQDRNTAQSLSDQADVAAEALGSPTGPRLPWPPRTRPPGRRRRRRRAGGQPEHAGGAARDPQDRPRRAPTPGRSRGHREGARPSAAPPRPPRPPRRRATAARRTAPGGGGVRLERGLDPPGRRQHLVGLRHAA